MFKKSDTKLIVESWRNFINEDYPNTSSIYEYIANELIKISGDVYKEVENVSKENMASVFNEFIREDLSDLNDKTINHILDRTSITEILKLVNRRVAEAPHIHLLRNFLRKNISNSYKFYQDLDQNTMFLYNLGNTASNEWIDNLLKFLRDIMKINENSQLYRHISQYVHNHSHDLKEKCKNQLDSPEDQKGIKAFLFLFLTNINSEFFRSEMSHIG